jgi:hypothetical protein
MNFARHFERVVRKIVCIAIKVAEIKEAAYQLM